jgi:HK97 family phage major capsid protein
MRNEELIQKADMVLADLATAGKLNPEQTDQFIRTLIDQPTILAGCRTVAMSSPEMKINKIGFGSRILQAAQEDTAPGTTSKPDLGQVQLNTSEVIAQVNLSYDVIEDNIERGNVNVPLQTGAGGLHQTIVDLIAERAALDLEELAISGNTGSGDPYLALQNGFLAQATSNVVNVNGAFDKNAVKSALKTMPTRYLRNRAALQHFVSVDNETELRDQFASRQTAKGDQHVEGNLPIYVFGSKVTPVALMPGAQGLFTDPMNLIFGVQRNIQIEYTKDITKRVFIIVLTARIAFAIEEVNAIVKYSGLVGSR